MNTATQLAPAPYSNRSHPPTYIPLFYTSDLFVNPAREDVAALLDAFAGHFVDDPERITPEQPFAFFKQLWKEQGWVWIHLKCTEPWSRIAFLQTMMRLFIEKIDPTQSPAHQVAAFFGLYTFHATQPRGPNGLYALNKIPIAIDTYQYVLDLPNTMPECFTVYLLCLLNTLIEQDTFSILPESSLHPYSTRDLPNASVVPYEYQHSAKGGRPSKSKLVARTRATVNNLNKWADMMDEVTAKEGGGAPPATGASTPMSDPPPTTTDHGRVAASSKGKSKAPPQYTTIPNLDPPDLSSYISAKSRLKDLVPLDILNKAEDDTRKTMKGVEEYAAEKGVVPDNGWLGVKRLREQRSMLDFIKPPPSVSGS